MPQRKSVRSRKSVLRSRKSPKKSVLRSRKPILRSRKSPRKYRSASSEPPIKFVQKGKGILLLRLADVKNFFEDNKFELFDIKNLIKIIPKFFTKTPAERSSIISIAKINSEKVDRVSLSKLENFWSADKSDKFHIIDKCKRHLEQARTHPVGYFTSLQNSRKDVQEFQKYIDWVIKEWSPIDDDDDDQLKEDLVTLLKLYKAAIHARGDLDWPKKLQNCIDNVYYDKIDMINAYPKFSYPSFL